jgi:DNA-directed RNA polymerase subunit L
MTKDIIIKVIDYKPITDNYNNYLVLEFNGSYINNIILNTLRRVIMELIPIYAFDKSDIAITKNTSIYNNDYMKLRISQFPIFNVDNDISNIDKCMDLEYESNLTVFDQQIENIEKQKELEITENVKKAQNFIINIDIKNTTNNVLNITTDSENISYYYKGKNIPSPYKSKLLIIKLKPNEEFACSAKSSLNISLKNIIYCPVAVCVFTEKDDNTYIFNIESLKQLTEKEILLRACDIINKKLDNFLHIISKKIIDYKSNQYVNEYNLDNTDSKSNSISSDSDSITSDNKLSEHNIKGMIVIENESHTFGNLLTKFLQDHPKILFAGYKIDHLLIKELTIAYKTNGTNILDIFDDIIKDSKNIFTLIKNKISNLKL